MTVTASPAASALAAGACHPPLLQRMCFFFEQHLVSSVTLAGADDVD